MPESISSQSSVRPPKPDFNVAVRDVKVIAEREAKRNEATQKERDNRAQTESAAQNRERIRQTEQDRKSAVRETAVQKRTEEAGANRRQEEQVNPRSGDIINVVA